MARDHRAGPFQGSGGFADIDCMNTTRVAASLALVLAACTTPAQSDGAALPAAPETTTTITLPAPPPTTTTSTTVLIDPGPDIVAWLSPEAPAVTLQETISAWVGIETVTLVDPEGALAEAEELFADRPSLIAGLSVGDLPTSLRIELSHPMYLADVTGQLRSLSDIDEVVTAVTPTCNAFPDWNVVVFVADDRQLTRLRNELASFTGLSEITAVGRDEALAEYTRRFESFAGDVTVQDMLVSLRARTTDPVALALVQNRFADDAAVAGIHVANPGVPDCR
ncbi:MAG: hypothetical protein HKN24_15020 [Acidimicrobiales bacterium]|nr:hypothetical protein [Acidimicrobiales bacterium]